jgi:hypothetical protein
VAELIVENKKSHTIGESLIIPACSEIVCIMFGSEAEAEIQKYLFSIILFADASKICQKI